VSESAEGVIELVLSGEVDAAVVDPTTREARELLRQPGVVSLVVDLGAVTFIDSLGLGLLVNLHALADDRGAAFVLRNTPAKVTQVLQLTGLLDYLGAQ
jgi:anti-anti-sigma factor